jgi:hypothetical protein
MVGRAFYSFTTSYVSLSLPRKIIPSISESLISSPPATRISSVESYVSIRTSGVKMPLRLILIFLFGSVFLCVLIIWPSCWVVTVKNIGAKCRVFSLGKYVVHRQKQRYTAGNSLCNSNPSPQSTGLCGSVVNDLLPNKHLPEISQCLVVQSSRQNPLDGNDTPH